jgi:hypothetical protein
MVVLILLGVMCDEEEGILKRKMNIVRKVFYQNFIERKCSLHASCPTQEQTQKWVSNQWFRNKRVRIDGKDHLYDNVW